MQMTIVMNPTSGAARGRLRPDAAAEQARVLLRRLGADAQVRVTEYAGHAQALAREAANAGVDAVCAWGGDGTVHEVATALARTPTALAIVPTGSGNGFARALGIPLDVDAALEVAVRGRTRRVDAGEANGRLFFATVGLGLDAAVAHAFASDPRGTRGLMTYLRTGARCLFRYQPFACSFDADGARVAFEAVTLIALANTRQWGNGAAIAPGAVPDDGQLDATVVAGRTPAALALQAWRLWAGSIDRMRGVTTTRFREATIACPVTLPMHVDGEPAGHVDRLHVRVVPGVLAVRVPATTPGVVLTCLTTS